jgi:hypothetical protein
MSGFETWLSSLPSPIVAGLFGAAGGALGGTLMHLVHKLAPQRAILKTIGIGVAAALAVVASRIPDLAFPDIGRLRAANALIESVGKDEPYVTIFAVHPEAVGEIRKALVAEITLNPSPPTFERFNPIFTGAAKRYLERHQMTADEASLADMIVHTADTLQKLADRPRDCVSYFQGTGSADFMTSNRELILKEGQLMSAVIGSSARHPSRPARLLTIDEVTAIFVGSYQTNGFDLTGLAELERVGELPPERACLVATQFTRALTSPERSQIGLLFKSLLALR